MTCPYYTQPTPVNLNSHLLSTEAALKLPAAGSPSKSLTCEGRKKKRGFAGNKLQRSPPAEMSLLSPHWISEGTWAFADTFSVGNLPRKLGTESWICSRTPPNTPRSLTWHPGTVSWEGRENLDLDSSLLVTAQL